MTNREYILQRLQGLPVTDAVLLSSGINLDGEYTPETDRLMIGVLEDVLLAPYLSNVSESGFSVSWDREAIGNWYYYLCRKHGVEANDDVLSLLGISMIKDISDLW